MQKRHKFSQEFKAKVALAAIKGDKTTAELSSLFGIHSNLINRWATVILSIRGQEIQRQG